MVIRRSGYNPKDGRKPYARAECDTKVVGDRLSEGALLSRSMLLPSAKKPDKTATIAVPAAFSISPGQSACINRLDDAQLSDVRFYYMIK